MAPAETEPFICCIGAARMDRILRLHHPLAAGTSNPVGSCTRRGGAARNVAENLARLGVRAALVTVVGNDAAGQALVGETAEHGVDVSLVQKSLGRPTASSTIVFQPDGELFAAFADMEVCAAMDRAFVQNRWLQIERAAIVFAEASLPADSLAWLIAGCREHGLDLVLDAASAGGARNLPLNLNGVALLICNADEARAVLGDDIDTDARAMAGALCQRGARAAIVTAGAAGAFHAAEADVSHYPAPRVAITDTSGAGDAFAAGVLYGRLRGLDTAAAIRAGHNAAAMALRSEDANCPELAPAAVLPQRSGE